MPFEIVLKAGEPGVPTSRVPGLIAGALRPPPPEGRTATYLEQLTETEWEHRSAFMANVRYGNLVVLSRKTNLPTDENNPAGFVPMEDFINYVAQFNVNVRFADE